ncbi:MAG: PDZ domain-containing protein [Acidobacteria bacterium]|nr:PDZ domain-containing protein [Acidobacteriota bacterium]
MRSFLIAVAFCTLPLQAQSLRGFSKLFQELAERVDTAVVQIVASAYGPTEQDGAVAFKTQRASGSGVVVDANGYIVTNAHVIGVARRVQVLVPEAVEVRARARSAIKPAGKLVTADVIGLDRETDIAVLKVEQKGLPFLAFGDSDEVAQGQLVFAFGSPFGLENSVSMGVVSSVARQVRPDDPMIYIQTDAAINPGNSGGPLVDSEGSIVGINTFILSRSGANAGVGFAVPSSIARNVYQQIVQHGAVRRGQIGVVAQTITPQIAKALELGQSWGVILSDVSPRSAAEAGGLRVKDVVLEFNGKVMENARQLGVNIYQTAGQTVTLKVLRGSETLEKRVAVLERPQDPDRIVSLASGRDNHVPKLGAMAIDLDVRVAPLLPPLRRLNGAVIAAAAQPLLTGDVVYEINNKPVQGLKDLNDAVAGMSHGDVAVALIERGGQLQFLEIEIE